MTVNILYALQLNTNVEHLRSIMYTEFVSRSLRKGVDTICSSSLQQDARRTKTHCNYMTEQKYYHSKNNSIYMHHKSDKKVHPSHPLHKPTPRLKKQTRYTRNISTTRHHYRTRQTPTSLQYSQNTLQNEHNKHHRRHSSHPVPNQNK